MASPFLQKLRKMSGENETQSPQVADSSAKQEALTGRLAMDARGVSNTAFPVTEEQRASVAERIKSDPASVYGELKKFGLDDSDWEALYSKYSNGGAPGQSEARAAAQGLMFNAIDNAPGLQEYQRALPRGATENSPKSHFAGEIARGVALSLAVPGSIPAQAATAAGNQFLSSAGSRDELMNSANFSDAAKAGLATAGLMGATNAITNVGKAAMGDTSRMSPIGIATSAADDELLASMGKSAAQSSQKHATKLAESGIEGAKIEEQASYPSKLGLESGADDMVAVSADRGYLDIGSNPSTSLKDAVYQRKEAGIPYEELNNVKMSPQQVALLMQEYLQDLKANNAGMYEPARKAYEEVIQNLPRSVDANSKNMSFGPLWSKVKEYRDKSALSAGESAQLNRSQYEAGAQALEWLAGRIAKVTKAQSDEYALSAGAQEYASRRYDQARGADRQMVAGGAAPGVWRAITAKAGDLYHKPALAVTRTAARRIYDHLARTSGSKQTGGSIVPTWKMQNWARMLEKIQGTQDEAVALYALRSTDPEFARLAAEADSAENTESEDNQWLPPEK